ncbi:MAG: hypothetical protein NT141_01760 [candidate division WWE3 bacterium]|nr:hypothetical protein [candidate division WWE3 bacterium]
MGDEHPFSNEALKKAEKARNLKAAVSYLWLGSLFTMLTNNGDAFVAMHARQGVTITLFTALIFIPGLTQFFLPFVGGACAIMYGLGFYMAYQGREFKMPGIWDLSQKIFRSQYIG